MVRYGIVGGLYGCMPAPWLFGWVVVWLFGSFWLYGSIGIRNTLRARHGDTDQRSFVASVHL